MPRTANQIHVIGKKRALSLLLTQQDTIIGGIAALTESVARLHIRQEEIRVTNEEQIQALRDEIAGLKTDVKAIKDGVDTEQGEVKEVLDGQQEVITALEKKVADLEAAGTPIDLTNEIQSLKDLRTQLSEAKDDLAATIQKDPGAATGDGTAPAGDGSITTGSEG